MGNCLNLLPSYVWIPTLASLLLLVFVIHRLILHRGQQRRSEAQLLQFSDLQLLTTTLTSTPDLEPTVDQTLDGILQALELTQGYAILHLPAPDEHDYTTARGFSAQAVERLATGPLRDYLAAAAERWGPLMLFPDLTQHDLMTAWQRDPLFAEFRALFASEGPRTLLVVGLQTGERSYGTLVVGSRQVKTFQPGELRLALSFGNQMSVALENRSLQKAAEQHDEELRILHRVGEALSATFDLEMQRQILERELKGLIGAANFSLVFQESPDSQPETAATNIVVEGAEPVSLEELIRTVRDGLYIGRIWYTYPINGLRAGDFTCTVVGDSFIIRDGRLVAPLKANTVRINDNITRVLENIAGITKDAKGTLVWAADEVVYTPEIAVTGVHVDAIAGFMEALA